jgi:hypothetical protein
MPSGWRGTSCPVCASDPVVFPVTDYFPGQYEFVHKGDPPVVGLTKLDGITLEDLKRPWKKIPAP